MRRFGGYRQSSYKSSRVFRTSCSMKGNIPNEANRSNAELLAHIESLTRTESMPQSRLFWRNSAKIDRRRKKDTEVIVEKDSTVKSKFVSESTTSDIVEPQRCSDVTYQNTMYRPFETTNTHNNNNSHFGNPKNNNNRGLNRQGSACLTNNHVNMNIKLWVQHIIYYVFLTISIEIIFRKR